ncbi:hypothetical protein BIV57_17250 [Mangrovactinospora gilvigrisea]|uniref:Methyltransferase domain-containing protein n=1 Tax=Mangrovactinospora gilvigrisea TaxID=1428644 RepID=A0A1J7BCD9_9ACTN|nr:class I SAM-dependent methyltransferase [Mangrovactinospora gilvigrisea]OIV36253.1 hypothetical protein BIV57_17250 [Mangrovactinospora gilvigrisea]
MDAAAWDERYAAAELLWSAGPNRFVAEYVEAELPDAGPGLTALDLAAGEGRNAVWLAERGWDVTAVDFSAVALERAAEAAERRGVALRTRVADLLAFAPEPSSFDLVLVSYLHLPAEAMRGVLGRAAEAVRPGGRFFLVGHADTNLTEGHGGPQDPSVLHSPEADAALLAPPLTVTRAERVRRETADGHTAIDTLVTAHR